MNPNTEAGATAILGAAISEPFFVEGMPLAVVPDGFAIECLEQYLPAPLRRKGVTTLRDVISFCTFVSKEAVKDSTLIYGNLNPPSFVAVFNEHTHGGNPGFRDHRAVFACPLSIEWNTWKASSGKQMTQEQFAQFIEDNLPDIRTPAAAEMLEISRTLEAKKKVNFASGIRLTNGANELTYEETISGTASKGKISVPEQFTIGIPVLEGGYPYAVDCRLRYRIADGGKMTMWFEMIRPHKTQEDAIKEVWKQIQDTTGVQILNGSI